MRQVTTGMIPIYGDPSAAPHTSVDDAFEITARAIEPQVEAIWQELGTGPTDLHLRMGWNPGLEEVPVIQTAEMTVMWNDAALAPPGAPEAKKRPWWHYALAIGGGVVVVAVAGVLIYIGTTRRKKSYSSLARREK